ncbi:MAG: hypothetical protein H6713_24790 [Myxococcales bacterium]|nr:hypothetical protein [Myxococcales bacterium]MCB9753186.1 hypothetical protein [Myxococcales bacterium]
MIDALLNLWITRLHAAYPDGFPRAHGEGALADPAQAIYGALAHPVSERRLRRHVVVLSKEAEGARDHALAALRRLALNGARGGHGESLVTAWLVVNVPVASTMSPTALVHRMVRRLYLAAVLHGLGELPALREAVVSLRQSFLQTRGSVSLGDERSRTSKSGAELGLSLDSLSPLKLTAAEEVGLVERFSAALPRADLFETEDQLIADLQLLGQLEMLVARSARLRRRKMPRWERVRSFFKDMYDPIRALESLELRPVFVLEAGSAAASVTLLRFLSEACALASGFEASLVILGGPPLGALWAAERRLGASVSRGFFTVCGDELVVDGDAALHRVLLKLQAQYNKRDDELPVEVAAALDHAVACAAAQPTDGT